VPISSQEEFQEEFDGGGKKKEKQKWCVLMVLTT
jgi:hypothetical protein